jgi:hypothetical protein
METAGGLTSGEAMAAVASSAPVSPGPAASAALSPASAALPPASAALSPASAAALEAKQEGLALEQAEDRIAARLATPAAGTKP